MLFIYSLCIFSTLITYANVLLQKPQRIASEEIERLAQNWENQFIWTMGFNGGLTFTCCYKNSESSFILQLFGIPLRSHNFQYIANIKRNFACYGREQRNYHLATPLRFVQPSPHTITIEQLATLLNNKAFIFYTGAGLSAAGNVATMDVLENSLKMHQSKKAFIRELIVNPEAITDAFSNFCKSAIYGLPTAAHYALHEIAQERQVAIVTENIDFLQHRTESVPLFIQSDVFYSITSADLQEIDIIVCTGLSYDDRGFLSLYKQHNPAGIIVAIDIGMPSYLSEQDSIVQEDMQIVLPALACLLKN